MSWRAVAACAVVAGSMAGCTTARQVQCDQSGGTVAIPANTNIWPTYYRDKAEELIRRKCPNGYEIVREQEVVTGQVAHVDAQTETKDNPALVIGGTDPSGKKPGGKDGKDAFGGLVVPLGETKQTTRQTTTYRDVTEWRIEYRAK